jgi:HEAT repeat protein
MDVTKLFAALLLTAAALAGCAPKAALSTHEMQTLAMRYITAGANYQDNPVVRAQALEALQKLEGERAAAWFHEGLRDQHPGVRFAACMALGTIRHKPSEARIRIGLTDPDPNVRVAAMFALRRLGDTGFIKEFAEVILSNPDPGVRRNAVLALGRLEEPGAIGLLKKAREDKDDSVQLQALEAMALLGDKRAVQQLIYYASGGLGDRQAFALETLGRTGDPRCMDVLRYCLKQAEHLESRLAAAQALARMGSDEGFALAMASLNWNRPNPRLPDDPPANQVMRVRSMAAFALGAIGKSEALEPLRQQMQDPVDPRVQVAAATAILQITRKQEAAPFERGIAAPNAPTASAQP